MRLGKRLKNWKLIKGPTMSKMIIRRITRTSNSPSLEVEKMPSEEAIIVIINTHREHTQLKQD